MCNTYAEYLSKCGFHSSIFALTQQSCMCVLVYVYIYKLRFVHRLVSTIQLAFSFCLNSLVRSFFFFFFFSSLYGCAPVPLQGVRFVSLCFRFASALPSFKAPHFISLRYFVWLRYFFTSDDAPLPARAGAPLIRFRNVCPGNCQARQRRKCSLLSDVGLPRWDHRRR